MHRPVLQKEVIRHLNPKPNENFIDCTVGEGGHALAILERIAPQGRILGIDRQIRLEPKERLILVEDNFANLKKIVERQDFGPVSGILFDLGMSSWHLEESGRGFSFLRDEPLDMRFDKNADLRASDIVNQWPEQELERIIREYGQERWSRKIAREIIEARKIKAIETTFHLRQLVRRAKTPPTRTFQAFRIAVNDELNNLAKALPQALEVLEKGGRLAVISFHSLEDRIAKKYLNGKPIEPSFEEIKANPRARSAKLRTIVKL